MSDARSDVINIEIDGKPFAGRKGEMIIEVADAAGVKIPRFCYHKKLSIAANCRMCLVEVERAPKPLPACATPIVEGMKVQTHSELALRAQKSVMEFLLINHPLDCPICDQGGECELQDVAMGYGREVSRFTERKRVVKDKNLGPLIATDMTRCIHCTRCVRFGEEVAGMPEMGATGRGEHMRIGTFIERNIDSELSGNMIDVCPVGALTSKPFRFQARTWELQQRAGVAPHDGVGSNLYLHIARGKVLRVVPRENEGVNEVWLSDRDRFSYEGLYSKDRLLTPMIREGDGWRKVDWADALERVAVGIGEVIKSYGADSFGALISPSSTCEEAYLAQSLVRGLGSPHIDHRLREVDFTDDPDAPPFPWLGQDLASLEDNDVVLLVGAYPRKEHPLINHRLRKAALRGARIMTLNPVNDDFNLALSHRLALPPSEMPQALGLIANALGASVAGVEGVAPQEVHGAMAHALREGKKVSILLGARANAHPAAAFLRGLAAWIANATGAKLGILSPGANGTGAWLAGALPHRGPGGSAAPERGRPAKEMLDAGLRGYLLFGLEPELDCADGAAAVQGLENAQFNVVLSAYRTPTMERYAHVMLPIAPFAETSGTYVNLAGHWQSFNAAVRAPGEARPGWKVLRVLGNVLDLEGFDYDTSEQVRDKLRAALGDGAPAPSSSVPSTLAAGSIPEAPPGAEYTWRVGDVPLYCTDPVVRRSPPLRGTADAGDSGIRISPALAQRIGVKAGDLARVRQNGSELTAPVTLDPRVAEGAVVLAAATPETAALGPSMAPIHIEAA